MVAAVGLQRAALKKCLRATHAECLVDLFQERSRYVLARELLGPLAVETCFDHFADRVKEPPMKTVVTGACAGVVVQGRWFDFRGFAAMFAKCGPATRHDLITSIFVK